jgi:hypothetical protein
MSMPAPKREETAPDTMTRFFGGPPLAVIIRLALISILVGVIMEALGFDPWNILASLERLVQRIWDLGFDTVRFLWRYLMLGAAVVIPIWLVMRLMRARRNT